MGNIAQTLQNTINKLIKPLKSEEELTPILKKRLTKKEYKLLQMMGEERAADQICQLLHLEEDAYDQLQRKLIKKVNQEKLKQELMV